ncbi:uncharacterized protein LOC143022257 isoform X2 [Oratosquilla oratoria]|uniref:uncharacterized protein LOC143022257 isoform X2 n=1 Tax=Oratosquilla oratoria TaxID=337810 RepID=UPI003F76E3A7
MAEVTNAGVVAEEEALDPRVQVELEKLNTATDEINKLETKLDEANNSFRTTLTESTARLKGLAKKLGACVEKSRPYYEAKELARCSQMECQRAAVQYQRANALHQAAKETISLAEERFVTSRHENWQFDSAWQEMLNHATIKVMEAEAQKAASEREHQKRAAAFTTAEQRVHQLERSLRSAINKSRIYFEQKAAVQTQLELQKEHVQQLQRSIVIAKATYAHSLRSLEQISEEIHEQRKCHLPREPGVGAEEIVTSEAAGTDYVDAAGKEKSKPKGGEEQYWKTLREKLQEFQGERRLSHDLPDVSQVDELHLLEDRQRSVTGSSGITAGSESLTEDLESTLERIVSGESGVDSEEEGDQGHSNGGGEKKEDSGSLEKEVSDSKPLDCKQTLKSEFEESAEVERETRPQLERYVEGNAEDPIIYNEGQENTVEKPCTLKEKENTAEEKDSGTVKNEEKAEGETRLEGVSTTNLLDLHLPPLHMLASMQKCTPVHTRSEMALQPRSHRKGCPAVTFAV